MSASFHASDEILGRAYDHQLMKKLLAYVRPYKGMAIAGIALVLAMTALMIAGPLVVRAFVDDVLRTRDLSLIPTFVEIYVGIEVTKFFIDYSQAYLLQVLGQNILFDIRVQMFKHLMPLPLRFFQKQPVGRLVTRIANDVGALNEMFSAGLITVFKDIFLIIGVIVAMLVMSWQLGLIALAVLPAMIVITAVFQYFIRRFYREIRRLLSRLNATLAEQIAGMREVQLFGREAENRARFHAINRQHFDETNKAVITHGLYRPAITLLYAISLALVLTAGGARTLKGSLTAGELAAFILLVQYLFSPIRDLAEKYNILQAAMASSERIFTLLAETNDLPDPAAPRDAEFDDRPVTGAIRFADVHFRYNPDEPVLRGVSLHAEPGEHIAIVGHTGAGKSTIINLLGRFYAVDSGTLTLDGIELGALTKAFIRRHVAVVHQDVFCFAGTIVENISLGSPQVAREQCIAAARAVHADEFIRALPLGYDAEVVEGGKTLSVGQRQLLAFARALAHDPAILVLDEATANIDTPTERLIQDALQKLIHGRTAVVIAHRLSTIQSCDRIYVLDRGEVVEVGSHRELVAAGGHYANLCEQQLAGARTAATDRGKPRADARAYAPKRASTDAKPPQATPRETPGG